MNSILSFFNIIGNYLTPYLNDISIAMIICLLIIFSSDVNRGIRTLLSRYHFLVRMVIFITINAFGYGLLIIKFSPRLASFLHSLQPALMLFIIITTFFIIGMLAQKKKHIWQNQWIKKAFISTFSSTIKSGC